MLMGRPRVCQRSGAACDVEGCSSVTASGVSVAGELCGRQFQR